METSKEKGLAIFYIFVGCLFVTGAFLEILNVFPVIGKLIEFSYVLILKSIPITKWIFLLAGTVLILVNIGSLFLNKKGLLLARYAGFFQKTIISFK